MNVNQHLAMMRTRVTTWQESPSADDAREAATDLAMMFVELDAHLSVGGTPPEAWREGPDAPTGTRYWTMPADPEAGHPEPYGTNTWGIVDEEAGGVVAWIVNRDTADAMVDRLNR